MFSNASAEIFGNKKLITRSIKPPLKSEEISAFCWDRQKISPIQPISNINDTIRQAMGLLFFNLTNSFKEIHRITPGTVNGNAEVQVVSG